MRNFLTCLSILLAGLFTSCQEKIDLQTPPNFPLAKQTEDSGQIPATIGLDTFIFNMEKYSWKDLDQYYRQTLLSSYQNESFSGNLRKATIYHLVNDFNLTEKADFSNNEFYLNELVKLNLISPKVFLKLLRKMEGNWADTKVKETAIREYTRNIRYINEELLDPKPYLQREGPGWERVKSFAEAIR